MTSGSSYADRERLLLDMEAAYRRHIDGRAMSAALKVAEAALARREGEVRADERNEWVIAILEAVQADRQHVGDHAAMYAIQVCKRIDQERAAAIRAREREEGGR